MNMFSKVDVNVSMFCSVVVDLILLLSLSYVINLGNVGCGLFNFSIFLKLVPCIILIVC